MVDIGLVKNGIQSAGGPIEDPLVRAVIEVGAAVSAESNPLVFSESDIRQAAIERSQALCRTNSTRLCRLFNDGVASIDVQFTKEDAKRVARTIFKELRTPSQPQPVTVKFIEMLSDPKNFRRTGPILDAIASGKNGVEIITGLLASFSESQIKTKVLALCSMEDSARAAQVVEKIIALSPDKTAAQGDWVRTMNSHGILTLSRDDERSARLARLQMFSAAAEILREKGFDLSYELLEICARYEEGKTTLVQQKKLQRELARFSDSRTNGQILFNVEYNSKEDDPKRTGKIRWLDVSVREGSSSSAVDDDDPEFEAWLRTEDPYEAYQHISRDALRACYRMKSGRVRPYLSVIECAVDKIATSCFQSALGSRNLEEMPLDGWAPFEIVEDVGKCHERDSGLTADHDFMIGPGNSLKKESNLKTWDGWPVIEFPKRSDGTQISFQSDVCVITFPNPDFDSIVCTPNGQCTIASKGKKFIFFASSVEDAIERGRAYFYKMQLP